MPNFYRASLLITDVFFSVYDAYIEAVSDTLGKIHVIAKNASSSKSKRRVALKKGHLIEAIIFHKNRYYLSDIKVLMPFSAYCSNLDEVNFLNYVLTILAGFVIYPDLAEFNFIISILELVLKDKRVSIYEGTIELLKFLHLNDVVKKMEQLIKQKSYTKEQLNKLSLKTLKSLINAMLK